MTSDLAHHPAPGTIFGSFNSMSSALLNCYLFCRPLLSPCLATSFVDILATTIVLYAMFFVKQGK
ncbi:unnamed protein product [Amoebophrya sp. A120]|nr:unnamed protein product [Amoebophrya sp. A120]|eukprot:GSA120T00025339001.1